MAGASEAAELLRQLRRTDGGYAPAPEADSEPEPSALAALALDDEDARAWLIGHQREDGGFVVGPAAISNDSPTPLAAIALDGEPRDRAIDYVLLHQAQPLPFDPRFPHDPATRGWSWTSDTFAWVEPTARAVLALKLLRPAAPEISDGIAVLNDRECSVGGWNYGNREVLGRDLEPFLQTSAAGLMAVQDGPDELRERAVALIESLWPDEPGGLGWAMSLVALRLSDAEAAPLARALENLVSESALMHDGVALAWAVLGLSDGWTKLRLDR